MPKQKFSAAPAPPEAAVLFPEEVEYIWTLAQFMQLTDALFRLVEGLITLGLTEANAEEFLSNFARLAPAIAPIVPEVLAVTLRLSPAEVAALPIGRQSALALKILLNRANQVEIKNFFADFFNPGKSAPPTP